MSTVSNNNASYEATDSEYGESPPADRFPPDQGTGSTSSEPASEGTKANAEAEQQIRTATSALGGHRTVKKAKVKVSAAKQYRELLNSDILIAAVRTSAGLEVLPPSQVGASYWTSTEKKAFFAELRKCGPVNLPVLSGAVGSKSEAEIRVYLKLLQDGVCETDLNLPIKGAFSIADIPAAYEVQRDCETALDEAADKLAWKIQKHDERLERDMYGDGWLIEEEVAALTREEEHRAESMVDAGADLDGQESEHCQATNSLFPSADLLRLQTFLQLSRNIFMSAGPGQGNNWRDVVEAQGDRSEPALYRTACDDFYNLAVSLTRRLVQATLFQATSRLRASDTSRTNWQPKADVREVDVRTAVDLLNLRVKWKTYWARLARRCGLDVYSDSKKYRDGRPTTKNGVKLTYEEVEGELGLARQHDLESDTEQLPTDKDNDEELDILGLDSDDFTDASKCTAAEDRRRPGIRADEFSDAEEDGMNHVSDSEDHTKEAPASSRKRRRALSPAAFADAEDRHLEALDRKAGIEEERRLWKVLGDGPADRSLGDSPQLPLMPLAKHVNTMPADSWRRNVGHDALWERFSGVVPDAEFSAMDELGRVMRQKRRRLQERLIQERLEEDSASLHGKPTVSDCGADDTEDSYVTDNDEI